MFSDKLFSLLNSFSKVELNRFRRFLNSPYFNDQPDLLKVFDACDSAIRKGGAAFQSLERKQLWSQIYPSKKHDDGTLRRLVSDLIQMGLRFKSAENREKMHLPELLELQLLFNKPEFGKLLNGIEKQIQKTIESQQFRSSEFYLSNYQFSVNVFNREAKTVSTANYIDKLLPANYYLDCFYVIQKLKFYISWLVYRRLRMTEVDLSLTAGVWELIEAKNLREIPLISIYTLVVHCLTKPDEEWHFKELMEELESKSKELGKEDLQECYYIAQNYCAFKINQGKTEYYKEIFLIFKNIINEGILLEENQLSEGVYKNIITSSLRVGEFEWAENFIEQYSGYLPLNIRENAKLFNLANLYSHQMKHDKVIELLRDVDYNDVVYSLGSKTILLRTYYEKKESMALDSLIDSFKIFIRRNKVMSKDLKREYSNFLTFLKKLTTATKQSATRLKNQITETKSVPAKIWLIEKAAQLEKK